MFTDLEETQDVQEERIDYFQEKRNQQLTEEGRNAEITVDLVLQARAMSSDNKVNGLEDAIVSEIAHGENLHYCEVLSRMIHGPDGIPKRVEGCETRLLEEAGCRAD